MASRGPSLEEIGQLQAEHAHDRLRGAAGKAMQQGSPIVAGVEVEARS